MKKRFFMLLALMCTIVFTFSACGGTPEDPNPGENPGDEYSLPLEDGKNQLTIYYNNPNGYANTDVWVWWDGSPAGMGGQILHECAYGAKMVINFPSNITQVGFIIRSGGVPGSPTWEGFNVKDGTDKDRFITITERETVIYTKSGDANNYISDDGGKTLIRVKYVMLADMIDKNTIKVSLSDSFEPTTSNVTLYNYIGTKKTPASVTKNSKDTFTIKTAEDMTLEKAYSVKVDGFGDAVTVVPLTYFSSKEFGDKYNYDGPLGVEITATETIFRLWAPTSSSVTLNLYDNGTGGIARTYKLTRGEQGVWEYRASGNLSGKYYTYTVTNSAGTREAVDPYAVSAGLNGQRGMILDMDSAATKPTNWSTENFVPANYENYTDAEIWEVHIRDFSNQIKASQYKGKYLAFTEKGLTENGVPVGIDYLKALGITHVHLLPSFDYASVDEAAKDGFNWGYDPLNYNVPEGSYSTDPANGAVRVKEYRAMVQALHDAGIGVIMDVVYNHTSGLDSNFNRIVPYYYYRFSSDGIASNGSGCGNETASDRFMFQKFMRESVQHWMTQYNVDGFRFDLMGIHDIETMQAISGTVYKQNKKALIYGEGWAGGTVQLAVSDQAILNNIRTLNSTAQTNNIAMFNDVIRDAVKGSVFGIKDTGFATGAKTEDNNIGKVMFGVNGGVKASFTKSDISWEAYNPTNVINYVSAHDNNTLWDRICHVYGEGEATLSARLSRNRLSAAIIQTALGVPFMQAGEEMLRQKKNADGTYNENSYNASDDVNNLKWNLLKEGSEQYKMMQYYQGLIAFRKAHPTLRSATAQGIISNCKTDGAMVSFTMRSGSEELFVVYNANETAKTVALPAGSNFDLYIDGTRAGTTVLQSNLSGSQQISPISCYVFVKK